MPFVVFGGRVAAVFILSSSVAFQVYTQRSSSSTSCKRSSSNLFWFPYGIVLHRFLLLPFGRAFFRFSSSFSPRVACGWFFFFCLSSSACRGLQQKAAASPAAWPSWLLLSSLFSPSLRSFSLSFLGESATGWCVRGLRREQGYVFKDASCLPLLLPSHQGGVSG